MAKSKWCDKKWLVVLVYTNIQMYHYTCSLYMLRGGSRIFVRRGCTHLLLYFNTNKPHSFFLAEYQLDLKTAGHRGRGGGGAHPLHPAPGSAPDAYKIQYVVMVCFLIIL